jgi:transposase
VSLRAEQIGVVPEETCRVARAAFPRGTPYVRLRDELGTIYEDAAFARLFPERGQPAEAPWRLALVSVLQYAEGLSDRQAAEAVRGRIDWKYVLGLELTDAGFDASVLSEFRTRLVAGDAEALVLDVLLARIQAIGLLRARGRQRTDSTQVLATIRQLNRLELVGETLRHALTQLAQVAPEWLREHADRLDADWTRRYGHRFEDFRLPKGKAERATLAGAIGREGFRLLGALDATATPRWLGELVAVQTLRWVWLQQYYAPGEDDTTRWRDPGDQPLPGHLIHSPYDVDARYSTKRSIGWAGYKVHLTETCDPDLPHLITHTATTPATTPDWNQAEPIHDALAAKALLPDEHLLDGGYVDAGTLVTAQVEHQVTVVGPVRLDTSWQAQAGRGFDLGGFRLDWDARRATCPQGALSTKWSSTHSGDGAEIINIRFSAATCRICPVRADCTTSTLSGREITVRPQLEHLALQEARSAQLTPAFKARYDARAGIEGTLSQALRLTKLRQARYRGLARTRLQHLLSAAALNLHRLDAWWLGRSRAGTRPSPLAAFAISA